MANDEEFVLKEDNYYSPEADKRYMSYHQYTNFVGTPAFDGCPERALKMIAGEYKEPPTKALLVGSYFDAAMEGTLEAYKGSHPECFTKAGELKSEYRQAEVMLERVRKDEVFMKFCDGQKQLMLTGNFAGCDWRGKLDVYIPGKCIVDIKTSANLRKTFRVQNGYTSFVEAFGYIGQLAVYQKLVEINYGEHLPCYIAAVSKEDVPDMEIIGIDDEALSHALEEIIENMPTVLAMKEGRMKPRRCERCDYCKSTRKITGPIHYMQLIEAPGLNE